MNKLSIIILVVGGGFIIFQKWKQVLSFFMPNRFWNPVMNYQDGSQGEWLHYRKRLSDKTLFHEKEEYYPNFKTHYYRKKVRRFYFNEGTREGLDLKRNVIIRNTKLENSLFDLKLANLFDLRTNNLKILEDYGLLIGIGIVGTIVFVYMKKNGLI